MRHIILILDHNLGGKLKRYRDFEIGIWLRVRMALFMEAKS